MAQDTRENPYFSEDDEDTNPLVVNMCIAVVAVIILLSGLYLAARG